MAMIRHAPLVLWQNSGVSNITITNGVVQWFVNNTLSAADFNHQPAYWYEIPTQNCDYMFLQYTSKLESIGTITNVNASHLSLSLQGMMHTEDAEPFNKPYAVRVTNLAPSGDHGGPEYAGFQILNSSLSVGRGVGTGGWQNTTAEGGTGHHQGALFLMGSTAPRAPSVNDRPGWLVNIGARSAHNTNDGGNEFAGGFSYLHRISGYSKVWVAFNTFIDIAGAGPIRIKGKIICLRYTETPGSNR